MISTNAASTCSFFWYATFRGSRYAPLTKRTRAPSAFIRLTSAMLRGRYDCTTIPADMDGAFPESFYSTTSFRTQVRLGGEWIDVEDQEMDCGILVDPQGKAARCLPMAEVRTGDRIVVGRHGLRVFPAETTHRQSLFEFMASPVSSEKPKGVTVREIAAAMRRTRQAGEKVLAVLGPVYDTITKVKF